MAMRLENSEDPPELRKGSGKPVTGMTPMVMPILTKTWKVSRRASTVRSWRAWAST